MRFVLAAILLLALASPLSAEDTYEVTQPDPPTGDMTVTVDMLRVGPIRPLISGTITLGAGVRRSDVRIIPADGAIITITGGDE